MWQLLSWPPCDTKTWRTCRELWPLDISHICLLIEHACFCLVLVCILQPGAATVPTNRWSVSCSDKPSVVLCLCGITLAKSLDPASRFRSQLCWLFSRLARFHLPGHPSHGRSASNLSPGHFWHLGSQVWPGEPAAVLHILYSQWCQFTTAHTSLWDLVVKFLVILLTDVKPPVTWNQLWWENLHTEEIKCYREGPCVGFLCSQLVFWHHSRTRSSHAALD